MNSLNRDISRGEVVVLSDAYVDQPTPAQRAFVCIAGAGMFRDAALDKIYGHWADDPRGYDFVKGRGIDPAATEDYQKEKGYARQSAREHNRIEIAGGDSAEGHEVHDTEEPLAARRG